MSVTTGQLLAQRYRLGRRIAVGGMGEVWEAEDTRLGRQVAVKVLKPELSGDAEFRARFHTEARMTASLNHPGIAAVHDYGETAVLRSGAQSGEGTHTDPNTAFLVMELVEGDPLSAILLHHPRLSAERTLDILGQAADAVAAAHERGLVHRDIKPANILIMPTGRVKLTDFGIAKARDAADTAPVTRQGIVMGTAHYIAPEQAAGQPSGPASDVYSLGVVGYECLAGQRPFVTDSAVAVAMMHIRDAPPPLPPDVPPAVRALIEATLVKDPRQRYQTGAEFATAVGAVRAGRRPPLPSGLAGTAATTALTGHHQPGQTALLPPGALSGPVSGPVSGPRYGPPSGPHTGPRPRPYPGDDPERRHSGRRTAMGVAVVLLVVLGLVLGGYLIREVVRSSSTTPGSGTTAAPGPSPSAAPEPTTEQPEPAQPAPTVEEPTTEQPTTEPTPTEEEPEQVFINPGDYFGRTGRDAAQRAQERGLEPKVIDDNGDEIDPDAQSECRVFDVKPAFGSVEPGSTVELTCRGGP